MDWVAKDSETALHPSCTTKIGPQSDPMAVLDPSTMQVWGTKGLRVVDAGCMPNVSNGNTYAPDDDDRREGSRPDPRQRTAAA